MSHQAVIIHNSQPFYVIKSEGQTKAAPKHSAYLTHCSLALASACVNCRPLQIHEEVQKGLQDQEVSRCKSHLGRSNHSTPGKSLILLGIVIAALLKRRLTFLQPWGFEAS